MSESLKSATGEQAQDTVAIPDWSILEKYAQDEQRRAEKFKSNIEVGAYDQSGSDFMSSEDTLKKYEQEQIVDRPKLIKKLGRAALDALNIHFSGIEKARDREAMSIAVNEFKIEKTDQILQEAELSISHNVQNIMQEDDRGRQMLEKQRRDDEEFVSSMDKYRENIITAEREKRAQEMFERGLNDKMNLHIDDIAGLSEIEGSGIVKGETFEYDGAKIQTYHITDLPFRFIQHALDFKATEIYTDGAGKGVTGTEVALELLDNPELWLRDKDGTEKIISEQNREFGYPISRKIGNSLSTSYVNLGDADSRRARIKSVCAYGWTKVRPDTIIKYGWKDLSSSQLAGNNDPSMAPGLIEYNPVKVSTKITEDINIFDEPSKYRHDGDYHKGHNEIYMRRFDEDGKAWRPEFIVYDKNNGMRSGMSSIDIAAKHAAFYQVPILFIDEPTPPASPAAPPRP